MKKHYLSLILILLAVVMSQGMVIAQSGTPSAQPATQRLMRCQETEKRIKRDFTKLLDLAEVYKARIEISTDEALRYYEIKFKGRSRDIEDFELRSDSLKENLSKAGDKIIQARESLASISCIKRNYREVFDRFRGEMREGVRILKDSKRIVTNMITVIAQQEGKTFSPRPTLSASPSASTSPSPTPRPSAR